jgi:hypothetical protein
MLSSNAEVTAHHDSSVTWILLDFRHVSGQDNVAHALSRENSVMTPIDYHAPPSSQDYDAELQDILKNSSALRVQRVKIPGTDVNLYLTHPLHNRGRL